VVEVAAQGGRGTHAGLVGDVFDAVIGGLKQLLGTVDALGVCSHCRGVVPVAAWKWRARLRELMCA
jgi:hypothetical protein